MKWSGRRNINNDVLITEAKKLLTVAKTSLSFRIALSPADPSH